MSRTCAGGGTNVTAWGVVSLATSAFPFTLCPPYQALFIYAICKGETDWSLSVELTGGQTNDALAD